MLPRAPSIPDHRDQIAVLNALVGADQRAPRRAEFPKNRRFPGRMLPHFIDEGGVRCAMAHLMDATGAATRDFVQHVARSANYARIPELAGVPALVAWLDANGLTLAEAARIQPTYCGTPANA